MKFLLLGLFIFSISCIRLPNEEGAQFSGGREKKETRARNRVEQNPEIATAEEPSPVVETVGTTEAPVNIDKSSSENLIFPFQLSSLHSSLLIKSSDHKKISFSVDPKHQPLTLLAGLSGSVSLNTSNGTHYLKLTPTNGNVTLHFELSEAGSTLQTKDKAQVSQGQVLVKSTKPILYYISSNSEISVLCLNTSGLEQIIKVVKDLPKTDKCL